MLSKRKVWNFFKVEVPSNEDRNTHEPTAEEIQPPPKQNVLLSFNLKTSLTYLKRKLENPLNKAKEKFIKVKEDVNKGFDELYDEHAPLVKEIYVMAKTTDHILSQQGSSLFGATKNIVELVAKARNAALGAVTFSKLKDEAILLEKKNAEVLNQIKDVASLLLTSFNVSSNNMVNVFSEMHVEYEKLMNGLISGFDNVKTKIDNINEALSQLSEASSKSKDVKNRVLGQLNEIDQAAKKIDGKVDEISLRDNQLQILKRLEEDAREDLLYCEDYSNCLKNSIDIFNQVSTEIIKLSNYKLGEIYSSANGFAYIIEPDFDIAFKYYSLSARMGYAPAQYKLATLIREGFHPRKFLDESSREELANEWTLIAANQGLPEALYVAASEINQIGVRPIDQLDRAAEENDISSQETLINKFLDLNDIKQAFYYMMMTSMNPKVNSIEFLRKIAINALSSSSYMDGGMELCQCFLDFLKNPKTLNGLKIRIFGAFSWFLVQRDSTINEIGRDLIKHSLLDYFQSQDDNEKEFFVKQFIYEEEYIGTSYLLDKVKDLNSFMPKIDKDGDDYFGDICQGLSKLKPDNEDKKITINFYETKLKKLCQDFKKL